MILRFSLPALAADAYTVDARLTPPRASCFRPTPANFWPSPSEQPTSRRVQRADPKMLATAAFAASRPVPMRTRPLRKASCVA